LFWDWAEMVIKQIKTTEKILIILKLFINNPNVYLYYA